MLGGMGKGWGGGQVKCKKGPYMKYEGDPMWNIKYEGGTCLKFEGETARGHSSPFKVCEVLNFGITKVVKQHLKYFGHPGIA